MQKPKDPKELAEAILSRSVCCVMVGAVIADGWGIHSWGWNGMGSDGYGMHAEAHAISRANPRRLKGSTVYVAALRKRNGKPVGCKPCPGCAKLLKACGLSVRYRDGKGVWV